MVLQAYNDIEILKQKQQKENHPDLSKIRPVIFWDTEIEKIDWDKNKTAVVKRIFERGNDDEKMEIIRFYGKEIVLSILENYPEINIISPKDI